MQPLTPSQSPSDASQGGGRGRARRARFTQAHTQGTKMKMKTPKNNNKKGGRTEADSSLHCCFLACAFWLWLQLLHLLHLHSIPSENHSTTLIQSHTPPSSSCLAVIPDPLPSSSSTTTPSAPPIHAHTPSRLRRPPSPPSDRRLLPAGAAYRCRIVSSAII